jgi:formyl-CoA transferase
VTERSGAGDKALPGPLEGVRVLEAGTFIAGPFAGQQLADLGAEVVKIEPPRVGDPMRHWRDLGPGDLWWPSLARNTRLVALDLSTPEGAEVFRRLAEEAHVLVENFRPGTLERWGIGPAALWERNPRLVVVRVSGFGQDGPRAAEPGFGSVGEAMGGIRHLTGWPDRPSTRTGISLGDQVTSLFAVIGALGALRVAERTGVGQVVDVAICEAVLALMESTVAEYELCGVVRNRTGPALPGVAPSNVYPTREGAEVLIAANSDTTFRRLADALGLAELPKDPRFSTHTERGRHAAELDALIAARTSTLGAEELLARCRDAQVPATKVYTAADIASDPHFRARGAIRRVPVDGLGPVAMSAPVPRFSRSTTAIRWPGPLAVGADTGEVLRAWAGLADEDLARLEAAGAVSRPGPAAPAGGGERAPGGASGLCPEPTEAR